MATVADFEALPDDARLELIDGRLLPLDRTPMHQFPLVAVHHALEVHCPADLLAVPYMWVAIDDRNLPRPDIIVMTPAHPDDSPVVAE